MTEQMKRRESGFYWVMAIPNGRWEPAELLGWKWYVIGAGRSVPEAKFHQIGERITPPTVRGAMVSDTEGALLEANWYAGKPR